MGREEEILINKIYYSCFQVWPSSNSLMALVSLRMLCLYAIISFIKLFLMVSIWETTERTCVSSRLLHSVKRTRDEERGAGEGTSVHVAD